MVTKRDRPNSYFATACYFIAGYLGIGAGVILAEQLWLWNQTGAWIPHQMWQVLAWSGWQHPPAIAWGSAQGVLDWAWDVIGNCPISLALVALGLFIASVGLFNRAPAPRVRAAHQPR